MKIELAQYKPVLGDVKKNLENIVRICRESIKNKNNLIVFPELALSGYLLEDLAFSTGMREIPGELLELSKEISIVIGGVERGSDRYIYNSAYYLEGGEILHTHRKVYLPTYGMFDEARYFRAGNSIMAFHTKFGKIGMLICEDMWHPASAFILAQDGAEHIIVLTNSPARGLGDEMTIEEEWDSLLHSAAISNTVFITMVNRTGVEDGVSFWGGSRIYAPNGDKILSMEDFRDYSQSAELDYNLIDRVRFAGGTAKNENLPLILKELNRVWKG
ncbi:MAG: nitrilase-related carbon-nitrogen hydrolase [Fusobacteriaceae bacterium]